MPSGEVHKQPVTSLAGIGSQTAARMQKLGIRTLQDLLFHLPQRYQDRTRVVAIRDLIPGGTALVQGAVEFIDAQQRGRSSVICRIGDRSGFLSLRFFHFSAQQIQQLQPGVELACFGEVRMGFNGLEMIHPEYRLLASGETAAEPALTPVYPGTEGLHQASIRKAVKQALQLCLRDPSALPDVLPDELRGQLGFPRLSEALLTLHQPPPGLSEITLTDGSSPALQSLALEEFLAHHLALWLGKQQYRHWQAPVFTVPAHAKQAFLMRLPFTLTRAQTRVVGEIEADCAGVQPMLRLVQGDVGSGKTVVAALAALAALSSGYQVALMAPTELLAEQHFRNFSSWFADSGHALLYLSGQSKGKARAAILQQLADGSAGLVVGTHALFQDAVQFHKLGLVIIDEQHRFGVHQRQALRAKGQAAGLAPHQLVMTATPIPRTLAMLQYADLDISVIDELPPGRRPVTTSVLPSERRADVVARIAHWLTTGKQAYWVCTLIEESEQLQCEAAEQTAESLRALLPQAKVGLVHGRMKPADKEAAMQAFKSGLFGVLVATTVIEVGVDVPNAGLMIIENAERLGLSQLHQLRGRVGRGNLDSYCLLLYQSPLSEAGKQRLGILRETHDGFVIAERDLELRGPGEIIGSRQTGQIQFKIADLARDRALLDYVEPAAALLRNVCPQQVPLLIARWLGSAPHPSDGRFGTIFSP
ncbi:ATP-dependent DNA helicase RecG [Methylomonas rhizoryzae]|uniref:ATP-dependent DNA helicase RecG n=1 Tax=Methylomonas rhizoryzae TaxID=2608981 RepID=UPI0012320102|nr:ATP-dependent DNA helicase RecG [Methylomonas rhizoryzae]